MCNSSQFVFLHWINEFQMNYCHVGVIRLQLLQAHISLFVCKLIMLIAFSHERSSNDFTPSRSVAM